MSTLSPESLSSTDKTTITICPPTPPIEITLSKNEESLLSQSSSPFPMHNMIKLIKDEEWISGSELKTDNSSSDDELSPSLIIETENQSKRQYKKKKLKVSFTEEDEEAFLKETVCKKNELLFKDLKEGISEENEDDADIYWRPKRATQSASLNFENDSCLALILTKNENNLRDVLSLHQIKEQIQIQKFIMLQLDKEILIADKKYKISKNKTKKILIEIITVLEHIVNKCGINGRDKKFIKGLTNQWNDQFVKREKLNENQDPLKKEMVERSERPVMKIKSRLDKVSKNIKMMKFTKMRLNPRLPKLTADEETKIDELLKNNPNETNAFKFNTSENSRLNSIEAHLKDKQN